MTETVLSPEQIARLSAEERLSLIEALWDSLSDRAVPVTAAQAAELDRREETYPQDAADALPWKEVRQHIERKLR